MLIPGKSRPRQACKTPPHIKQIYMNKIPVSKFLERLYSNSWVPVTLVQHCSSFVTVVTGESNVNETWTQ